MGEYLSLGGGVPSTTLFLMSLHGEIHPPCVGAIFSDTGWERQQTYENIARLEEYAAGFGVPVYQVSNGNIRKDSVSQDPDVWKPMLPFYSNAGKTKQRRDCTLEYKIVPIRKKLQELTGATYKQPVKLWIGYTVDEAVRMKPSRVKYIEHRHPLIELRLGLDSCYEWLKRNGFEIPVRSSCVGCPFHRNTAWQGLSESELQDAADFEVGIQSAFDKLESTPYLHRSCTPIGERPFLKNENQLEMFDATQEECEGGCFL